MKHTSRRDFLKLSTNSLLALAGALGLGGLFRFLSYQYDESPQTEFDIGTAYDYPFDSRTILAYIPAVIIHDKNGFQAISLQCTHLGCMLEARNFGFECPCHGSRFDPTGVALKGPAVKDLKKLRVEKQENGNLHVFTT
jgi:nitrite reductase/ring-hydroxylating ferredoxin subunit